MKPIIIGISGKAGSGKDTVADILVKEFGFKKFVFADALKEMVMKHFGLTYEECYGKKTECSRRILQGLGGGFVRQEIDEWYWIKQLDKKITSYLKKYPQSKIVISDVRYKNEYKSIKNKFGTVIYDRGLTIRIERKASKIECGINHASETELDNITDWDLVIHNDHDLITLKELVRKEALERGWDK